LFTDHGVKVLFTEYGNREEIPYEYLQPVDSSASAAAAAAAADSSAGKLYTRICIFKVPHIWHCVIMNTMSFYYGLYRYIPSMVVLKSHRSCGLLRLIFTALCSSIVCVAEVRTHIYSAVLPTNSGFIMCFSLYTATGPRKLVVPKAALNEDGTFKIPDNLRLQKDDTEAEKLRKRAKVKVYKNKLYTYYTHYSSTMMLRSSLINDVAPVYFDT
jgi:hypothetical protein